MTDEPPRFPPPAEMRVVFDDDVWHPLDHLIGSPRCRSFQRGVARNAIRKHWNLYWEFKAASDWNWLLRATHCWFGRHAPQQWWRSGRAVDGERQWVRDGRCCQWCRRAM